MSFNKNALSVECFIEAQTKVPLWKSLSLAHNLKKLAVSHSNSDGLDCINGLKVFSMFLIIMGHRIMFCLGSPMVNSDYVESVSYIKTTMYVCNVMSNF